MRKNNLEKEKRIFKALGEGKTYKEISRRHHVSFSTIRKLKKGYGSEKPSKIQQPTKRNGPEFLSFLIFISLLLLWIMTIYNRPVTIDNIIISIVYFVISAMAFYKMKGHRY